MTLSAPIILIIVAGLALAAVTLYSQACITRLCFSSPVACKYILVFECPLLELMKAIKQAEWQVYKIYEYAGISGSKGRDKRPPI